MIKINGAEQVVFGIEDMESAQRFVDLYGLDPIERSRTGGRYEALDGSGIELRLATDDGLPTTTLAGPTSRMVVWGVEDQETLQLVGAELTKDREVVDGGDGMIVSRDDDGHAIGFRLTRRRSFEAPSARANAPGAPMGRPINDYVDFKTPGKPRALGHVVFWSDNPGRSMAFYQERLQFRPTDMIADNGGVFARAAAHADHHSLFFLGGMGRFKPSFQHVEFQFRDFQEVMVGGQILADQGWTTHMGPGRHVMGSNWYWYFNTPMGGAFELSADMDQVDDNWQPRVLPRSANVGLSPQWSGPMGMGRPPAAMELKVIP